MQDWTLAATAVMGAIEDNLLAQGAPPWIIEAVQVAKRDVEEGSVEHLPKGVSKKAVKGFEEALLLMSEAVDGGTPTSVLDEWYAYNEGLIGPRNAGLVAAVLGIGQEEITQTEASEEAGVTRQRVSQIVHRYLELAKTWAPPLVGVRIAEAAAKTCGAIVTAREWNEALPPWLRASTPSDLGSLSRLIDLGWLSGLESSSQHGIWFQLRDRSSDEAEGFKKKFESISRFVTRQLGRAGAVHAPTVEAKFGEDGAGLAYAIVDGRTGVDEVSDWLLPQEPRNSVLVDRARRVLSMVDEISIVKLKRQLERSVKVCPPHHVVMRVLERDLDLEADSDGMVSGEHIELDAYELLSPGELAAFILLEENRVMVHREFQKAMVKEGFSASLASVLASRSAILQRPQTGTVSLVGTTVTEVEIKELKEANGSRTRTMLGHRHLTKGGLEVRYRVDPDLIATTTLSLPVGKVEEGTWSLEHEDVEDQQVEVHRTYVTGLAGALDTLLDDEPRVVTVSFMPRSRTVSLKVY